MDNNYNNNNNMQYQNNYNNVPNDNYNYNVNTYPQQMMYPRQMPQLNAKKKRTPLILGLVITVLVLIASIIAIVIIMNSDENKLVGSWRYIEKQMTIEFTLEDDNEGILSVTKNGETYTMDMVWEYDEDSSYLTLTVLENLQGNSASTSFKVINVDDNALIIEENGITVTFTRID